MVSRRRFLHLAGGTLAATAGCIGRSGPPSTATDSDAHGGRLVLDPDRDALYTRSGVQADAATAYDAGGAERWTFDPPSTNAWPEAATSDALVATAITGDHANEPFYTVYAVNGDGKATASMGRDTVFEALGTNGTIYLADGNSGLLALEPRYGPL